MGRLEGEARFGGGGGGLGVVWRFGVVWMGRVGVGVVGSGDTGGWKGVGEERLSADIGLREGQR